MKKKLLIVGKLAITSAIVWWVIHRLGPNGLQELGVQVRRADPFWLLMALLTLFGTTGLGVARWQMLLRVQGIRLRWSEAIWITAAGMFFNAFLVGATGGDVIKAWYAADAAPQQKARAVLSIAVDRLIGMAGLLTLATWMTLTHLPLLLGQPQTRPLAWAILASLPCAAAAIALFSLRQWVASLPGFLRVWRVLPFKKTLSHLSESYAEYGMRPGILVAALGISMLVHASIVIVAWFVGLALGVRSPGLGGFLVYCPLINGFSAIPISVGGLGLRETAFLFFFSDVGGLAKDQTVALSLVFWAVSVPIMSLLCGLLFLMGKPKSLHRMKATPPS
ncbi:MAG: flippase-like domain-containing protein [Verrucomicrobiae bacterium]|nr:flippase-like domain-containing protein [Verrucomicrobiae bacterium]